VRNIRRVRFDLHQDEMIREIPNYPDQPQHDIDDPSEPSAIRRRPTREEIARFREADLAAYFGGPDKVPAAYRSATPSHAAPTNGNAPHTASTRVATDAFVRPGLVVKGFVGTDAPGCPGGPELPRRSAPPPKPTKPTPTEVNRKPPVNVKREARNAKAELANVSSESRSLITQAPKERKNAAHRASGG
jgi:hypothetical protein